MKTTRFKLGDRVRYTLRDEYIGGSVAAKQKFANEKRIFVISNVRETAYYVESNGSEWYANDDCLVPAVRPTIIIKRK